jgi:cell division protein FtsB
VTGRRRHDGRPAAPGQKPPAAGAPSQGAWTTPAVVVRGPDGRVVDPGATRRPAPDDGPRGGRRAADGGGGRRGATGAPGSAEGAGAGARRRVRPRRIPGAPGAVLLTPTLLTEAADDRETRRRRRLDAPVATVTALPPRPPRSRHGGGDDGNDDAGGSQPTRPRLRPVRPAAVRARQAGPGGRRQRVAAALAGLSFERLLPPDEDARARRALRLRRCAMAVASVGLVAVLIYSVFPVRTWIDQRAEADRAREQQEVFERENARLEQEARDLRTEERIEELARELGLVMPGEELYGVLPGPEAPAETPPTTAPEG